MLRELWQDYREGNISIETLLEALVEAIEPRHTCGECRLFHTKCPAYCVVLGADTRDPACEHFVAKVEPEDTPTEAIICKLRKELAMVHETCDRLSHDVRDAWALAKEYRQSRDEARARIDCLLLEVDNGKLDVIRFRKECDEARAEIEKLHKERDSAEHKLEALDAIDERILADAEIGRLVRGMHRGTSLRRSPACYHSWHYTSRGWEAVIDSSNPAEALRAIQEVADDYADHWAGPSLHHHLPGPASIADSVGVMGMKGDTK